MAKSFEDPVKENELIEAVQVLKMFENRIVVRFRGRQEYVQILSLHRRYSD